MAIGINVGDIIIEGEDILGDGVNIAARVEGIAEPGGISISEDAWRQVQGKVAANFVDAGEQSLKNIARPVRVSSRQIWRASSARPKWPNAAPARPRIKSPITQPEMPERTHATAPLGQRFRSGRAEAYPIARRRRRHSASSEIGVDLAGADALARS